MRVLVVEDDEEFSAEIVRILAPLPGPPLVSLAASRDRARQLLDNEFFDLVLLDLKIPTEDDALDAEPAHGHSVFAHARATAPGTPILVLTGTPAEDFVPTLLRQAQQIDIWGTSETSPTVDFLKKINLSALLPKLKGMADAVAGLTHIEVDSPTFQLPMTYDRLIRSFARRVGGALCTVTPLSGGLSEASVLRLKITSATGAALHDVVAKLGPGPLVRDENNRYDTQIARLQAAATPRKVLMLEHGGKDCAGIFYQLADGFNDTAFTASLWENAASERVPASLEQMTSRWSVGHPQSPRTVGEIRRRLLSDADLQRIAAEHGLDWVDAFEASPVQTLWCCVHGDLHGENALVSGDGSSVLIDYADVEDGPRCLDPVSLEFSLLFHPKSPILNGAWPSAEQARGWSDLEAYLVDCPVPRFVGSVRAWINRAAAARREVAATAYAYFVRQLKYETTDGIRAKDLIEGARELYRST